MNSMTQQNSASLVQVQLPILKDSLDSKEIIDFGEILGFILERKCLIFFITSIITLVACFYVFIATPIYQSDATLQVESEASPIPGLTALEPVMGDDVSSLTEMEIIKSRNILGTVVDELGLRIKAAPHYFPIVGAGIARGTHSNNLAPVPLGLDLEKYSWGGEAIQVDTFKIENGGNTNGIWHIEKGLDSEYRLLDKTQRLVLVGQVGKLVKINHPLYGNIQLYITLLKGRLGIWFDLHLISRISAIDTLSNKLKVSEKGKNTGIIRIALTGSNPELTKKILEQTINSYLKYDVEKKSKETAQTLSFIQQQLPQLKIQLDKTESALNEYRQKKGAGSVALDLETQATIDSISTIEQQLFELELENSELSERFTALHPNRLTTIKKIKLLKIKKFQMDSQLHKMPKAEWESVKLTRDTTVANELYVMLLNKAQEFKIVKAGVVGNAYILDKAIVRKQPITPKKTMLVSISLFSGLIFSIFLAQFLGSRKLNKRGLSSPEEIEQKTGYSVFVSILHSEYQEKLNLKHNENKIIARNNPDDLAVESLRSFRTALQFTQMESDNNIVVISGSAPDVGKSFVTVNLASVLADSGRKVLLIDGDLRKGYLHRYFGLERSLGLSDFIMDHTITREIFNRVEDNLHFLSTGTLPPNPSEILMSSVLSKLITRASRHYDVVLIDTPPILAVTDASIIAKHAGTVFMTLKWGIHSEAEIKQATQRFKQSKVHVNGLILNDIPIAESGRYDNPCQYAYNSNAPKVTPQSAFKKNLLALTSALR